MAFRAPRGLRIGLADNHLCGYLRLLCGLQTINYWVYWPGPREGTFPDVRAPAQPSGTGRNLLLRVDLMSEGQQLLNL